MDFYFQMLNYTIVYADKNKMLQILKNKKALRKFTQSFFVMFFYYWMVMI